MTIGNNEVRAWFAELRRLYVEHRDQLTALDAAIGDADHGTNMERGFTAVDNALTANPPANIAATMQAAAGVLIRTVGGAAGPLYGTFFLRAAPECVGKQALEADDILAIFRAGIEGVMQRGKARAGDKTMLDALLPALAAMERVSEAGAMLEAGAAAAEEGARATTPMQARKGRASYLGDRSIGHQDPGATSSAMLVRAAADLWR